MGSSRLQRRTGMALEMLHFFVIVVLTLLAFWVQYKTTKKFSLLQFQESLEAQNEKPNFVSSANEERKDTDSQFGVAESDVKKKEDSLSNVSTDENKQTQESNAEMETHGDEGTRSGDAEPAVENVKDIISSMLAKGIILGKDAVKKAKSFSNSYQLMNVKVRGLDEKLHVSEKLLSGASLFTSALNGVAKAATEIGQKTKDKVLAPEEQQSKVEGRAGTRGTQDARSHDAVFSVEKVKDVSSRMVSKGFILGEDALKKLKSFTQNNFTSITAAKVASVYQKIGLTEKISASKIVINDKMRGIGENFHVFEKLLSGASLVTSALNEFAKSATEIGQKTKVEGCAGTHGTEDTRSCDAEFSVEKVKDVFSRMVSKGFVLGEDALKKANSFTENNQFTSTTAAKVASVYQKIRLNEKISASKIVINDKMRGIGENLHVYGKLLSGASLVTSALNGFAKAATEIGHKTKVEGCAGNHGTEDTRSHDAEFSVEKVQDVFSRTVSKGFILGEDTLKKAKSFTENNQFTSTSAAKVASAYQKIGLNEKISASKIVINDKMRGINENLHVSEKLLSGASLVTSALNGVAKAATEIGQKTKVEDHVGTQGTEDTRSHDAEFSVEKLQDVFSRTVSKGFVLGEDALKKAKSFTENNQFTYTTAAKVASVYQKIRLNEKISASKIVINDKMRGMDEKLHVSENLLSGASLFTSALNGVAKAATEIGQKTKVEDHAGTQGTEDTRSHDAEFSIGKVKDVFSRTVSKGFILGEDALKKENSLTQNNKFTSTTAAKVASAYQKIGLNEKISASKIVINDKMRGIGENLHVSEKISTGASLFTGALKGIAKRAGKIGQKTEEKQ